VAVSRRLGTGDSRANNRNVRRWDTRSSADQDAFPARVALQQACPDLGCQCPADVAERLADGHRSIRQGDLFVSDCGDIFLEQFFNFVVTGRAQVKQARQGGVRTQPFDLFRQGTGNFQQQICTAEDFV
jgi:hypothetical protein